MSGRPIVKRDAEIYIANVKNHGIDDDIQWIINEGRFPVGCRVLDVGSGTGKLALHLAAETDFHRNVYGIELSPELVVHAKAQSPLPNLNYIEGDFLDFLLPPNWHPDTVVMSFYLHHCDEQRDHLQAAAQMLPHGGRLYVYDRVAIDKAAMDDFKEFWEREYSDAHEWDENLPNLCCETGLIETGSAVGLRHVRHAISPHDKRPGTDRFPKTLMEFWRQVPGCRFPAVALVSPAHQERVDEIIGELAAAGLAVKQRKQIGYTSELIQQLYKHCPWRERLADFVADTCPNAEATALVLDGDSTEPGLLQQLTRFKKSTRDKWPTIRGLEKNGIRPMILPFHVAEPHESEALVQLLDIEDSI